jgi:hypothetical protein
MKAITGANLTLSILAAMGVRNEMSRHEQQRSSWPLNRGAQGNVGLLDFGWNGKSSMRHLRQGPAGQQGDSLVNTSLRAVEREHVRHAEPLRKLGSLVVSTLLPDLLEAHQIGAKLLQRFSYRGGAILPPPEPPPEVPGDEAHARFDESTIRSRGTHRCRWQARRNPAPRCDLTTP